MYKSRWNKVKAYLKKKRMDAYVVKSPSNIRYLYASHLPQQSSLAFFIVIFRKGEVLSITSALEAHRTKVQGAKGVQVRVFTSIPQVDAHYKTFSEAIEKVLKENKARKVFCDGTMDIKGIKVVSDDLLARMRLVKDKYEIERIRKACRITDIAAASLKRILKAGKTERQAHIELNTIMKKNGADACAFDTIVASGPHSAFPHHDITDRKLQKGDAVTCDFGALRNGYCADLTRTYFVGKPSKELLDIYRAVREAYFNGVKSVKVGGTYGDVDKACRDIIIKRGYGKYYVHSTGHGVGLDVHEEPRVAPGIKDKITKGAVFTIEPGIYVPGVGGARIENDVYVGPKGVEVLNKAKIPKY